MLGEAAHLGHLEAEVTLVVLHFVFLDLQQRRHLSVVVGIGLPGVEGDDVAHLGTLKELLLIVHLNIIGHQHGTSHLKTAFLSVALLVELAQVTLEKIALLIAVSLLVFACTRCEHVDLLVDQLVVNSYIIVHNLILSVELHLEFGGHGNIEHEGIRSGLLQILRFLLLGSHGLTEHLNLVILDILVDLLTHKFVDGIHLNRCAKLPLNQSHRNHSGTEAGVVGFLAIVLQCLLDIVLVVSLFDSEGQQTIHLVGILKRNLHLLVYYFILLCYCLSAPQSLMWTHAPLLSHGGKRHTANCKITHS